MTHLFNRVIAEQGADYCRTCNEDANHPNHKLPVAEFFGLATPAPDDDGRTCIGNTPEVGTDDDAPAETQAFRAIFESGKYAVILAMTKDQATDIAVANHPTEVLERIGVDLVYGTPAAHTPAELATMHAITEKGMAEYRAERDAHRASETPAPMTVAELKRRIQPGTKLRSVYVGPNSSMFTPEHPFYTETATVRRVMSTQFTVNRPYKGADSESFCTFPKASQLSATPNGFRITSAPNMILEYVWVDA